VPPEALQIVVIPGLLLENMDQEIAIVYQDPFAAIVALYADWHLPLALQLEVDLVANCLILPGAGARADNEIVAETGYFAEIEHLDVLRFFGFSCPNCCEPGR
jgi:hypothetical protein